MSAGTPERWTLLVYEARWLLGHTLADKTTERVRAKVAEKVAE